MAPSSFSACIALGKEGSQLEACKKGGEGIDLAGEKEPRTCTCQSQPTTADCAMRLSKQVGFLDSFRPIYSLPMWPSSWVRIASHASLLTLLLDFALLYCCASIYIYI